MSWRGVRGITLRRDGPELAPEPLEGGAKRAGGQ